MSDKKLDEILAEVFGTQVVRRDAAIGEVQRKAFTPEVRGIDDEKRTITFVASSEDVDRYGDVLRASGWDLANYRKNPVFLWGHRSGEPPIGRTVDVHTESNPRPALVQTVEFAPRATYEFADTVFKLYRGGYLNAVSVGFRPLVPPKPITDDEGRMTGYEFTKMELLELSAVPLPANSEATMRRAIDSGIVTEASAAKFFARATPPGGGEAATEEDWAALWMTVTRLRTSVERGFMMAREQREVHSVDALERLLRLQ